MRHGPDRRGQRFLSRPRLLASALAVAAALSSPRPALLVPTSVRADETKRQAPGRAAGAAEEDDDRAYRRALSRITMQENCLICHSEEMITSQRLTRAQWKTEIDKMIGWGAPVPSDQVASLVDFLAEYSPDSAPAPPPRVTLEKALSLVSPRSAPLRVPRTELDRGAALYATDCATCHGQDAQGADLGPNLVGTPVLLRPTDFGGILRKGQRRMPGFQTVLTAAQSEALLAWLQTRTFQPRIPK
jgi:ubiquinol-cytochrome c reductase cytochrome c subunit